MTPVALALQRGQRRLLARFDELEASIPDDGTLWPAYCETLVALAAIAAQTSPSSNGSLLTTAELAASLGVSSKTVLRRKKAGTITPALQLGERGRAAMRWKA